MNRLLIIVFTSLLTPLLACEDYPDPFGDVDEEPLVPQKSLYFKGIKTKRLSQEVIIMVKSLPLFNEHLSSLPLAKQDLKKLPHTKQGDRVYDLSERFPNCNDKPDLWVVYNADSGYLIANADPLLRASVNEYVNKLVLLMPYKMRFAITYFEVDRRVPLEIEALRKAKRENVTRSTGEFKNTEKYTHSDDEKSVSVEANSLLDNRSVSLHLNLFFKNEYDLNVSAFFELGELTIREVGISDDKTKGVLIVRFDRVDAAGRVQGSEIPRKIENKETWMDGYEEIASWLRNVEDLLLLLGYKKGGLVAPPTSKGIFNNDDLVYDLTELFGEEGVRFSEGQWILYNQTTRRLYANCSQYSREQIEEMLIGVGPRYPININAIATFYQVDRQEVSDPSWDHSVMLASHPKLLGRSSLLMHAGTNGAIATSYSKAKMFVQLDEYGFAELHFGLDVHFLEHNIKSEFKTKVRRDVGDKAQYVFVELSNDPQTNRSIVMMIEVRVRRVGYNL